MDLEFKTRLGYTHSEPLSRKARKAKTSEMMLSLVVIIIALVSRELAWEELECEDKVGGTARSCIENKGKERKCWIGRTKKKANWCWA